MEVTSSLEKVALKIILAGESSVGKSSLVNVYCEGDLQHHGVEATSSTIGVDFKKKEIVIDSYRVELSIWDTAGQERFHSLIRTYYREADGVVAVYDVTRRETFEKIEYWYNIFNSEDSKPVVLIVGNKIDREDRKVTQTEGLEYSKEKGALFIETSALIGCGIENIFEKLVRRILQNGISTTKSGGISIMSRSSMDIRTSGSNDCLC